MYQGENQDPAEGLTVTVESSGYPQPWETQVSIGHLFFEVDNRIDVTFDVDYIACDTAYLRLSLRRKESGRIEVTGFSYRPNDCATYSEELAVEVEQIETQCSSSYEWDGLTLRVHFEDCRIINSQPDSSGRPVVTSIALDGTVTSEPHRILCM